MDRTGPDRTGLDWTGPDRTGLDGTVGLANDAVTPNMSKSLDMRFHWIQDRVRQGQFQVTHIPGKLNIANFLTKALPVARRKDLAPFLALDDDENLDAVDNAKFKLSNTTLFAAVYYNMDQAASGCVDAAVVGIVR